MIQNSLRGQFGTAMHWYAVLVDGKNLAMWDYLNSI